MTIFLTSLTDGSSTGITDGESVEGSAFIERISVKEPILGLEYDSILIKEKDFGKSQSLDFTAK